MTALFLLAAVTSAFTSAFAADAPPDRYDLVALEAAGAFEGIPEVSLTTVNDPAYNDGPRTFVGYPLAAALGRLEGWDALDPDRHLLRFVCLDGYAFHAPLSALKGGQGMLATGIQGEEGWPSFQRGKSALTPAPFFLVWGGEPVTRERPWPYQLVTIEVIDRSDRDATLAGDSAYAAGRALFEGRCLSCHSINLVGGQLGPELNVPMNILEYRERDQLAAFIRSPQSFRAASPMPPQSGLSDDELSAILDYLGGMADHKVCDTAAACATLSLQSP
jgi:mono/diheme cytochrome c family protein